MSQKREKVPLLSPSTSDYTPNLFPPITGSGQNKSYAHPGLYPSASCYGVIEVTPSESGIQLETRQRKLRQPGGIATTPLVAIIAATVGLVLILTFATSTTRIGVQDDGSSQVGRGEIVLKAAAPAPIPIQSTQPKPRLSQSSPASYVDIDIPQGRLRGYKKQSRQGREYSAFYKVPYAAPPLGSLRFKDPVPPSPWEGLRDIPVVAPQCIQKEKYAATVHAAGEEDCLYANVYTPSLPPTHQGDESSAELLPVMVYVHGGGFTDGNGSRYGAKYFMDEDVVLITFQFRLGPFGCLSTGDEVIRGNMGLKDQVQMLKWTRDNARYFNGNPDIVTIYGNSGGGMCVGHLLVSPMTSGLFHRAISQSGTSLSAFISESANEVAGKGTMEEVGREMGCDTADSQKYWECLLEKDATELSLVRSTNAIYSVTIEDRVGGDESTKFMPEKPFSLLESGRINAVPYIVGTVNAEFVGEAVTMLQDENVTQALNDHFETFTSTLDVDLSAEEMGQLKEFYFGTERIWNGSLKNLGNMISDRKMVHCAYLAARYHAKVADTYLYWITKPPYLSYIDKVHPGFPAKELGFVHHADELQYLFLYDGYPEITKDDSEYFEFSRYLVKLWAHFAKTGTTTMDGVEWSLVNGYGHGYANSTYWLELNDSPALTTAPQQRMGFWDRFALKDLKYDW